MERIVLKNGSLIDGSGAPPRHGDLLISGDTIVETGTFDLPTDVRVIDCSGLTVTPGFIDAHSHSDLQVLEDRREKLAQGVTAEVVGNCGFSPYPAPSDLKPLHDFANGILCGTNDWGWTTAASYLISARRSSTTKVFSLLGHGTLRIACAGQRLGPLTERELDWMEHKLSESLDQGASGFSTGLMYSPGASAPFDELERLCRVVARHGRTYATHIRDYGDRLMEAVEEQLELARRTGCRLQISHFQSAGRSNWEKQAEVLRHIEQAVMEGVDVAFDCYPYTNGSTVLTQLLPQFSLEGGIDGLLKRLANPPDRREIAATVEADLLQGWDGIWISSVATDRNRACIGKTIAAISRERECDPAEVVLRLIEEENGRVNMLELNQSETNLRATLAHPLSNIISDGFYVQGRPHPRLYGTFPFFLGELSHKRKWLSLAEAVHKITEKPALRFGVRDRGRLARGYRADVVIFDLKTINSPATYDNPTLAPTGIRHVFRNGREVALNH